MPELASLYDNAIAKSISNALHEHNYGLILCISDEDPQIDLRGCLKRLECKACLAWQTEKLECKACLA